MAENNRVVMVEQNSAIETLSRKREYMEVDVIKVHDNPHQPRLIYEEERIQSLAQSIQRQGLLTPITVRPHPTIQGEYQCASGHMRLRAFRHLGRSHIPAFIEGLSDTQMMEHCITENMQRENLNPLEEAQGFEMLVDSGHTHEEVGKIANKSRAYISNSLRLLAMDPFLKDCVLCKTLDASKALLISTLSSEYEKYRLADIAMDWSLTYQELRAIVKDIKCGKRSIYWVREVPVEALYDDSPALEIAPSVIVQEKPLEPILVLMPGRVVDTKISLDQLRRLNCTKVMAEVHYLVEWLKKGKEVSTTVSVDVNKISIAPKPTEEQRKRLRLLCQRLRTHERQYPVGVLIRSKQ